MLALTLDELSLIVAVRSSVTGAAHSSSTWVLGTPCSSSATPPAAPSLRSALQHALHLLLDRPRRREISSGECWSRRAALLRRTAGAGAAGRGSCLCTSRRSHGTLRRTTNALVSAKHHARSRRCCLVP